MVGVHPEDRSCTKVHCHERALYFKSTAAHPSSSNATCCSLLTPPTPPHCLLCAHPPPRSHSPSHLLLLAAGYFVLSSVAGIVRSVGHSTLRQCVSCCLTSVRWVGWRRQTNGILSSLHHFPVFLVKCTFFYFPLVSDHFFR